MLNGSIYHYLTDSSHKLPILYTFPLSKMPLETHWWENGEVAQGTSRTSKGKPRAPTAFVKFPSNLKI